MKPHKWAKEIKAWADGAEILIFNEARQMWEDAGKDVQWYEGIEYRIKPQPEKSKYGEVITGRLISNTWLEEHEARINTLEGLIKPQPKEPQYLYVYKDEKREGYIALSDIERDTKYEYIGKIKLETDDDTRS